MSAHQSKSGSNKASRVRQRPPRRKPIDPHAGIDKVAESARVEAVLLRLAPQIEQLMPEAVAKREDHVILVLDSHSTLMLAMVGDRLDELRAAMSHDTQALLWPVSKLTELADILGDTAPALATLGAELRIVPPPGFCRLVVAIGHSIQIRTIKATLPASICGAELERGADVWVTIVNGEEQFELSLTGTLKWLLHLELDEIKAGSRRDLVGGYQQHARSLIAAENERQNPRPVGEVLIAGFGGEALKTSWNVNDGMFEQIELALERVALS